MIAVYLGALNYNYALTPTTTWVLPILTPVLAIYICRQLVLSRTATEKIEWIGIGGLLGASPVLILPLFSSDGVNQQYVADIVGGSALLAAAVLLAAYARKRTA